MPSTTASAGSKKRTADQIASDNSVAKSAASIAPNGRLKPEVLQADWDNFLQAYEKPTQIYRVLSPRNVASPTFLQRNLSYRIYFANQKKKPKKDLSLKEIVEKLTKERDEREITNTKIQFLNFILTDIKDFDNFWQEGTKVRLEFKIGRKCDRKVKRKDHANGSGRPQVIFEASKEMAITKDPPKDCPCVAVPINVFMPSGEVVSELHLFVRATFLKNAQSVQKISESNGTTDKSKNSKTFEDDARSPFGQPLAVRDKMDGLKMKNCKDSKVMKGSKPSLVPNNGVVGPNSTLGANESDELEPKLKRPRVKEEYTHPCNPVGGASEKGFLIGQVILCSKDIKLKIENTDYELILKSNTERKQKRLGATWETIPPKHHKVQDFLGMGPGVKEPKAKLSVAVRPSTGSATELVPRPAPVVVKKCATVSNGDAESSKTTADGMDNKRVIYQFLYNNNSRQQTECHQDLKCPWCSLNCLNLYSLLKHLKLCHPRFHFIYVPYAGAHRIDITINKSFDGSYSGSAFDLIAQPPGRAFARNGPQRRTPITYILAYRPKRSPPTLQEFLENDDDKESEPRRTYVTGHNRLYHHTSTCLPIHPKELDVDSEGEYDPEWLRIKTSMMIDEFTDVNEGEKELMKLWNLHVLKHNYVGDCQIPLACNRFVELQGKEIIKKNLYRNFVVHLSSMYDFNLLDAKCFHNTIQTLHKQMRDNNNFVNLRNSWELSQNRKSS